MRGELRSEEVAIGSIKHRLDRMYSIIWTAEGR
jgi:hypothetical protein